MRIDGGVSGDLLKAGDSATATEQAGYDGAWSSETGHDPFLPLVLAAERTEHLELGTAIAVAFARSPMNLAIMANDLQAFSKGRFMLGLGSQIKPHIEKRFSMPWSRPAARMRELILAMRAIWSSWNEGTKLDFKGEFYAHTLMTPFFNPGPNRYGTPRVFLAAVGERMTAVAGEVADGLLAHGFTTPRYFREATMPAIERGLALSGRRREDFQVSYSAMVVTGRTDDEIEDAARGVRAQLAFYGSTPAYRPVLEMHGWGDLQSQLNTLSKQGEWLKMAELIDDEVLNTFAVVCEPADVPAQVMARVGDVADRVSFYVPYHSDPEQWRRIVAGFKQLGRAGGA
jgi:probable F420-dependent oxidoreductase